MVPIPPPETRVGVPPVPEARPTPEIDSENVVAAALAGDEPSEMDAAPPRRRPGRDAGSRRPSRPRPPDRPGDRATRRRSTPPPGRPRRRAAISRRAEQAYWRAASIEAEPALRANYLVAHARVLLARGDVADGARPARIGARARPRPRRRRRPAGGHQLPHAGLGARARALHAARLRARGHRRRPARDARPAPRGAGRSAGRRGRGRGALPRARDPEPAAPRRAQGAGRAGARARRSAGRRPAPGRGPAPDAVGHERRAARHPPAAGRDVRRAGRMGSGPPLPGAGARRRIRRARPRWSCCSRRTTTSRCRPRRPRSARAWPACTSNRRGAPPPSIARRRSCAISWAIRRPRWTRTCALRTSIRVSFRRACGWSITSGTSAIWTSSPSWRTTSTRVPLSADSEPELIVAPGDRDDDAARGRDVALPVHARAGSGRRARDRRGRRPPGADREPPDRGAGSDADPRAHLGGRRRRGDALRDADRHGPRGSGPARARPRRWAASPRRAAASRSRTPPTGSRRSSSPVARRRKHMPAAPLPRPRHGRRPSPSAGRPTIPTSSSRPGARWRAWRRRCSATAPTCPRRSRPRAAACRRRAPPSCAGSAICWPRRRSSSCATPASATAGDERRRLRVIPTQPAGLLIAAAAAALSDKGVGVRRRAARSRRCAAACARPASPAPRAWPDCSRARARCSRTAPIDEPQARAVAEWLRTPGAALLLGSPETRAAVRADVEAALAALPDWQTFVRGAQHTRNRIGLLACTSPADALNVLKIEERGVPGRARHRHAGRPAGVPAHGGCERADRIHVVAGVRGGVRARSRGAA